MFEDDVHVMFCEQHADLLATGDLPHQIHQLAALLRGHAGGRLVHQQQARRVGQRHGELQPLDVAIGEFGAGAFGLRPEADAIEQRHGLGAAQAFDRAEQARQRAVVRQQRHLHVLDHGHGIERRGDLEGAADAEPIDLARAHAGDLDVAEFDAADIGLRLAVEHVEAGRLAGAVGADEREHLAFVETERHAAHGMHAAVGFHQVANDEQAHGASSARAARVSRNRSNRPMIPPGKATTSATITAPSASLE